MKLRMSVMAVLLLSLVTCGAQQVGKKTVILKPEGVPIVCVYQRSGQDYVNISGKKEPLLDSIAFYYTESAKTYYLGRIDRDGVSDASGARIFEVPSSMAGGRQPPNIDYPTSVSYVYQSGGSYRGVGHCVHHQVPI